MKTIKIDELHETLIKINDEYANQNQTIEMMFDHVFDYNIIDEIMTIDNETFDITYDENDVNEINEILIFANNHKCDVDRDKIVMSYTIESLSLFLQYHFYNAYVERLYFDDHFCD